MRLILVGKWLTQLFIGIQLVMFTPLFILSKKYTTGYASLDSYLSGSTIGYTISNPTFLHIAEVSLLFGSLFLLRKYPNEFMIKQELLFSLVVSLVCSFGAELTYNNRGFGGSIQSCFLWTFTTQYLLILLRGVAFAAFMFYLSKRCLFYFPLPFAWIFKDFSKFIFEPYCIRIFEAYLVQKEPNSRLDTNIRCGLLREDHGELSRSS